MRRLTEQAHEIVQSVLTPGAVAIDATAGNGHDTLLLAQSVGPDGFVYAFDVQLEALQQTAARLKQHVIQNVILFQRDHAEIQATIPSEFHGQVAAVMFNLGYLPGGDKSITTHSESTVEALRQSTNLLRPGGILTILAYTAHPGGKQETQAVSEYLNELNSSEFDSSEIITDQSLSSPPQLFIVRKQ